MYLNTNSGSTNYLSMPAKTGQVQSNQPLQTMQGTNYQGNPSVLPGVTPPGYVNPWNSTESDVAELGTLSPQYSQGFNALRSQALNQGPSTWLNMSQMANQMQLQDALQKAAGTNAGNTAAADSALAAQGGLSSGARERVQESGNTNAMNMEQGLTRQGMESNLGLEATDQQNRIGQLNNLVSDENQKENQWNTAFNTDVANQMANTQGLNSYNQNLYNTQQQAWAASQQAAATANSGKHGK